MASDSMRKKFHVQLCSPYYCVLGREKKKEFFLYSEQSRSRQASQYKNLIFVSSTLVIYGTEIKPLSTTRDIVCTDAGNFVFKVNSELD